MKIGKYELSLGLTAQSPNMYYLGVTYIWVIRGWCFAIDLIWFGIVFQITWPFNYRRATDGQVKDS